MIDEIQFKRNRQTEGTHIKKKHNLYIPKKLNKILKIDNIGAVFLILQF